MTFEEFFIKKRIDLVALKAGEPGLFAEFEKHFAQMGEKSFDHTKKYWFNKLRLQYHLAPGQKPEKMHLENQLAEQTIVETLTETIPAPTTGFKPRFKPGMAVKPAGASDVKDLSTKDSATVTPDVNEAAEVKDQNPPYQQEKAALQEMADSMPRTTDEADTKPASTSKPGFKPRFNMKITKGDAPQTKDFEEVPKPEKKLAEKTNSLDPVAPKPAGFKPRFNAKTMAAKPAEEANPQQPVDEPAQETPTLEEKPIAPKPAGFKPRFNAKTMVPKPAEEAKSEQPADEPVQETPTLEDKPVAPKPAGFKPRFNAKTTKPQPPTQD